MSITRKGLSEPTASTRLPMGLGAALVAIVVQSEDLRIIDCNAEAERLLGLTRDQILGRESRDPRWGAMTPNGDDLPGDQHPGPLALLTGQAQRSMTMGIRLASGKLRWLLVDADVFIDENGERRAVSSFMDVTDRIGLEAWQALTLSILDQLSRRAPLDRLLLKLAEFVEKRLLGSRCSLTLLSEDGQRLGLGHSPSLPSAYLGILDGLPIGPEVGSCGASACLGQTVIIADVMNHPNWAAYLHLPEEFGFRSCWSEPIFDEARKVLGTFAVYYDAVRSPADDDLELLRQASSLAALVIERCRARETLLLSAALFEQGVEAVAVVDAQGRVVRVNGAFERMMGLSVREAIAEQRSLVNSSVSITESLDEIQAELVEEGCWQGERLLCRANGETVPAWLSVVALRSSAGVVSHYLQTAVDLRESKAQAARIRELAFFDPLTGLPNRVLVVDRLRQAISSAKRRNQGVAILFLDLDRFKEVNDTLGHDAGDDVLATIGKRFASGLRRADTLGRLGGDEFVVIAEGAGEAEAALCAERMMASLVDPVRVHDQEFALGASIGIALYPNDGDTPETLMKHADTAMYRAKADGGGCRLYQPEMSTGLGERVALARDLRSALIDGGGLSLHYQPQVALNNGRLSGAECLMRWRHPTLGPISPAVFIPLAEERGMMLELGDWVLREACQQLAAWRQAGHPLPGRLAVNVSAHQLDVPDALTRIMSALAASDVPPADIELEVTESALMRNVEHAVSVMSQFREAGLMLSIDDFGTGYSSLSYLKRLPVERLKIDMSFVREMLTDRNDYAIVGSIVAMASPLRLDTVAEGVEHAEQAEALKNLGCVHAQGYLFGAPVDAAEFAGRWLTKGAG